MKILFIVGGLEQGKNGVGDYTKLLAKKCTELGEHQCHIIALNDPLCYNIETQTLAHNFSYHRIPATFPWHKKISISKIWLENFAPDWISLQFVSYAFDKRGIVLRLYQLLPQLVKNCRLQIMFHELWLGISKQSSWKEKIVGALQKIAIIALIKRLSPDLIHTSNSSYEFVLSQNKISNTYLPLFGNIYPIKTKEKSFFYNALQNIITTDNRKNFCILCFFGGLYKVWPPQPLFSFLHQASKKHQRQIVLMAIGRLGDSGKEVWQNLSKQYANIFDFVYLGELSTEEISTIFSLADGGIASAPYLLIGKSGSVAAMLEHGLPVIVNRKDWQISGHFLFKEENPYLFCSNQENIDKIVAGIQHQKPASKLPQIAKQFISDLQKTQ